MLHDLREILGIEISDDNAELLEKLGIMPPSRASRLIAASGRDERPAGWTADLVKARLREGAKVIERTERSPRPSKKLTWWPDWQLHRGITDFDRNAWAEGERAGTRAPAKMKVGASAIDICRAEQSLEWPLKYLSGHDECRNAISLWTWCVAKREPWSHWWRATAPSKGTADRRLSKAFALICAGLRADKIAPE
jgi:hypothetical protein